MTTYFEIHDKYVAASNRCYMIFADIKSVERGRGIGWYVPKGETNSWKKCIPHILRKYSVHTYADLYEVYNTSFKELKELEKQRHEAYLAFFSRKSL